MTMRKIKKILFVVAEIFILVVLGYFVFTVGQL